MPGYERRWKLTDAEVERVKQARSRPLGFSDVLRPALRSPLLLRAIVSAMVEGAKQALPTNQGIVWLIDAERTRRAVPDAASGACWVDDRPFLRVLVPLLQPDSQLLDFGCGAGRLTRQIAAQVAEVTCVDISPLLLAEARHALSDFPNVKFVQTRGTSLVGIDDEYVDLVFAQGVFSYLDPNPALAILDEIHRVLADGGRVLFNAYTIDRPEWAQRALTQVRESAKRGRFGGTHYRAYTESQLGALCAAAGFEIERTVYEGADLYPDGHLACIIQARRNRSR